MSVWRVTTATGLYEAANAATNGDVIECESGGVYELDRPVVIASGVSLHLCGRFQIPPTLQPS